MNSIARIVIALALTANVLAGTGTITQGSCYLTSEDKKTNFATLTRGLVVQVLGTNAEGRVQVLVPMNDPKVSVSAGWKNAGAIPEGTGWVSKLFIKLDDGATPAPAASVAVAPPAGKKKKVGLLGVDSGTEADPVTVAPGADPTGTVTTGTGTGTPTDQAKKTTPKRKVRSLLAESAKGKTILLVNIPAQTVWIYKNGARVMEAGCRVGERDHIDNKVGENSKTRVGEHRLTTWHEKYSNSTYGAWTGEWFQFFNKNSGAFGAHTAKFNDRAAQYVHGTYGSGVLDWAVINLTWLIPGSHGCVRVRNNDITEIRKIAPVGSQVVKVYALRSGTQEAEPTSDTWSNIYGYTVTAQNGWIDPEKGELIDYKDPSDAVRQ